MVLLLVAFSRWRIERMFEDSKGELGMDHFEVRRYLSIRRHLILTCVSHLFLAEFCQQQQKKRLRANGLPGQDGDAASGAAVESWGPLFASAGRVDRGAIEVNAAAERGCSAEPPQADDTALAGP